MSSFELYIDLVEDGTQVYRDLGAVVYRMRRRPTHIDAYTWMCDIDHRAQSHLADRRSFWLLRSVTGSITQALRPRAQDTIVICDAPLVYGVAAQSMRYDETQSVYTFIHGLSMIYEVMRSPLTDRSRLASYLDAATNRLYAGMRVMPCVQFANEGLRENRITTTGGGGEFNLRRAIETCELASPFGQCIRLWAYELNRALQQRWKYQSIASDIVGPFLATMLIPPEQVPQYPPHGRNVR